MLIATGNHYNYSTELIVCEPGQQSRMFIHMNYEQDTIKYSLHLQQNLTKLLQQICSIK